MFIILLRHFTKITQEFKALHFYKFNFFFNEISVVRGNIEEKKN